MEKAVSKQQKLQHCAHLLKKPLQVLAQLDGFVMKGPDDILNPDEHGLAVCGGKAKELFNGVWNMRLFIQPELSRKEALGLLDKMRDWIARSQAWPMFKPDGLPGKGYGVHRPPDLALQLNHRPYHAPCKLCGTETNHERGPALFVAGAEDLVCGDCGRKHAPELRGMLEACWTEKCYPAAKANASNGADEDDNLPF
jgi:hypothetical protein